MVLLFHKEIVILIWALFDAYDLSINKYKEVVYEKVEYPPTSEILADIEALNREIDKNLAELKALLNDGKEEESE